MSDITCGEKAMATRSANKLGKQFCSLAYLAKSTIAINDVAHVRVTTNGQQSNYNAAGPNVAVTAKVTDRDSPTLPIGSVTAVNNIPEFSQMPHLPNDTIINVNPQSTESSNTLKEEYKVSADRVDGDATETKRPWKLDNCTLNRRIPSVFMTHQTQTDGIVNSSLPPSKYSSLDCWDYTIELECLKGPQDLQLAAELGKTLLERNKELEGLIKEYKHTIDEQEQEIVYLKKHTTALREVNDSRLKVYEQLEVGIQELERANHRLLVENTSDKKHIKTLSSNIETLEARVEDLSKQLDEVRQALSTERRKNERLLSEKNKRTNSTDNSIKLSPPTKDNSGNALQKQNNSQTLNNAVNSSPENCSFAIQTETKRENANSTGVSGESSLQNSIELSMVCNAESNDEIINLVQDLNTTKRAYLAEKQRCGELEEQLVATIQENQSLQTRIAQANANEEMKSIHDELSILDEVRQGQMCSRCLRSIDDRTTGNDEHSSLAPTEECEEDEERSLLELEVNRDDNASEHSQVGFYTNEPNKLSSKVSDILELNIPGSSNPYRDLVEKYEALLEVQRSSLVRKTDHGISLAEEFQSSAANSLDTKVTSVKIGETSEATSIGADSLTNNKADKNRGRTPTELSEAETSSSGFSEETSNKYTQTDDRPGYFLCSIGDGEDCKFSIYDDVSPIDSRFRNRPEYRELFKEIFGVLKKAAENKEEGEKLPLLDDTHPIANVSTNKVPPVTPANEELPADFGEDTQSVISSAVSEQSFAMSECITKLERKTAKKHIIEKNQENKPPADPVTPTGKQIIENGRVLTPLKREPLDYLSVCVGVKKKNRRKNRNFSNDRSESPLALPTPPRFFVGSGKKRKEMRAFIESTTATTPERSSSSSRTSKNGAKCEWNGNSMVIYNRSMRGRNSVETTHGEIEYHPSTVSQDLHKLKKLDLSYAEVLRRADACNQHRHNQQQQTKRRNQHRH